MKHFWQSILLLTAILIFSNGIARANPVLRWGNTAYYDMGVGDSLMVDSTWVKLLAINQHFNQLKIGPDTLWMKVARRSLPQTVGNLRVFVADNRNVKPLVANTEVHGLLTKDALLAVSAYNEPLLDAGEFIFPVSYNDGFTWGGEEERHLFSFRQGEVGQFFSYPAVDFYFPGSPEEENHWLLAIENSSVVWVKDKDIDDEGKQACVLLQSRSNPRVFYVYDHLYQRHVEVREKQNLQRGEAIATAWGDHKQRFAKFSVVCSDSVPTYETRYHKVVNFFPQLYELYFGRALAYPKSFTKGRLFFGGGGTSGAGETNVLAFEEYSGKGWLLGDWNPADKLPSVKQGDKGNVRLQKVLFEKTRSRATNPNQYFDFEMNVPNGIYRIRAKVGDVLAASWQKAEFEGVSAGIFDLPAGKTTWTNEKAVKVEDRKLTVRVYVDDKNNRVAGLSEIVFQRTN